MIETMIGYAGKIVSSSKSCGPPMAIFNANVVVGEEVIWYGDIDIDKSFSALCGIAEIYDEEIKIFAESPIRIFAIHPKDKERLLKQQKINIKEGNGLVWTTTDPLKWAGQDIGIAREERTKRCEKNIKNRHSYLGILTPRGTEWHWYNAWFYKTIYKIYVFFKTIFNVFVEFPYYVAKHQKDRRIARFLHSLKTEIGYHRRIEGMLYFWPFKCKNPYDPKPFK